MDKEKDPDLERFLSSFKECPLCKRPNEMLYLINIYYSTDPFHFKIKELMEKASKSPINFQFGIPCCYCYQEIFSPYDDDEELERELLDILSDNNPSEQSEGRYLFRNKLMTPKEMIKDIWFEICYPLSEIWFEIKHILRCLCKKIRKDILERKASRYVKQVGEILYASCPSLNEGDEDFGQLTDYYEVEQYIRNFELDKNLANKMILYCIKKQNKGFFFLEF